MTKILFQNEDEFNRSADFIYSPNTRLNGVGAVNVIASEMCYVFEDAAHANRAIIRLRKQGFECFTVDPIPTPTRTV